MTRTTPAPSAPIRLPDRSARLRRAGAVTGIAYVAAWAVGLSIFPVDVSLDATARAVVRAYSAHPVEGAAQYALVEGLAGILLGVVLVLAISVTKDPSARGRGRILATAVAVTVSVMQCALGVAAVAVAQTPHPESVLYLFGAANRLDGVKMLAIAFVAIGFARLGAASARPPLWLRLTGAVLAVALVPSAVAYLLLLAPLAWTAYVSGALLLVWVAALGIWTTVVSRRTA